jgi:hypothetical protein
MIIAVEESRVAARHEITDVHSIDFRTTEPTAELGPVSHLSPLSSSDYLPQSIRQPRRRTVNTVADPDDLSLHSTLDNLGAVHIDTH